VRTGAERFVFAGVAWIVLALGLLLLVLPSVPTTTRGFFLFVLFAPPIYLIGETFFSWVFSEEHGRGISTRRFSLARILLGVVVAAIAFALSVVVQSYFLE
jgi:hypothetical protein